MASMKNEFRPSLFTLEGREQPGSLFSTGLDASVLAGAFLGDAFVQASRPALIASQSPAKKAEANEVTIQRPAETTDLTNGGTSKQAESLSISSIPGLASAPPSATLSDGLGAQRPGGDYGTRGDRGPATLFYGGDFNGVNGLANGANTLFTDSRTWDDFTTKRQVIDCAFSHNLMNFTGVTQANVKILGPGNAVANLVDGGLPTVYNGVAVAATQVFQSAGGFGFTEYKVKACGLGIVLPAIAGHYYLNVQPIGFNGAGLSYLSTTSGTNSVGSPINNNDSWFQSAQFGVTWGPATNQVGGTSADFSHGLCEIR